VSELLDVGFRTGIIAKERLRFDSTGRASGIRGDSLLSSVLCDSDDQRERDNDDDGATEMRSEVGPTPEDPRQVISAWAGLSVFLSGLLVLAGWVFDWPKVIAPMANIAMRPATALSLMALGICLFVASWRDPHKSLLWIPPGVLFSVIMLASAGNFFNVVGENPVLQLQTGAPSVGTIICLAWAFGGVLNAIILGNESKVRICGYVVTAVSAMALIGHFADLPQLYWALSSSGIGMAVNTAGAFLATGIGLISIAGAKPKVA